jgi:hypothetical protein
MNSKRSAIPTLNGDSRSKPVMLLQNPVSEKQLMSTLLRILRTAIVSLIVLCCIRAEWAACDIQIKSAGPCLLDATFGIPHVGDQAYAIKAVIKLTGTPTQPFRFKWTFANKEVWSDYLTLGPGDGYWWWLILPLALDEEIPWSVVFDPDGVSGDVNLANNTASGVFKPIPPTAAVDTYSPRLLEGSQVCTLEFQPNSGSIQSLFVVFGNPTSHGAQTVRSVTPPRNAHTIITTPNEIPALAVVRSNAKAATYRDTNSYMVELRRVRVNPDLLREGSWSELNSTADEWRQWTLPDTVCQSTASEIDAFVKASLPSNFREILTPYDAARALHKATMRALTYSLTPPHVDAVNVLRDQTAECSGFSALLTASLRNIGIPARPISGNREGAGYLGHVRVEFHLPGVEWLLADPTDGNAEDSTGSFAYYFGYLPNADSFVATDVGDKHFTPPDFFPPFNNFYFPFIGTGPNWWWNGGATFISYTDDNALIPKAALWTSYTGSKINIRMSDHPSSGDAVVEMSSDLISWNAIATNNLSTDQLNVSFSTGNKASFFRSRLIE